jgi:hypothetical protein
MATPKQAAVTNGSVSKGEDRVIVFDLNIPAHVTDGYNDIGEPMEVIIRVNGRLLRRMHPWTARRFGVLRGSNDGDR